MKKHYRIFKITNSKGEIIYKVKERFLFFFWETCREKIATNYSMYDGVEYEFKDFEFHTEEEAIEFIKIWSIPKIEQKERIEIVKEIVV